MTNSPSAVIRAGGCKFTKPECGALKTILPSLRCGVEQGSLLLGVSGSNGRSAPLFLAPFVLPDPRQIVSISTQTRSDRRLFCAIGGRATVFSPLAWLFRPNCRIC